MLKVKMFEVFIVKFELIANLFQELRLLTLDM